GLTERPHRCRTWAPRGQTPVLQYHFNWNLLSAIAGITWWSFYFRLFPGPIKGPQVVEFLMHLHRHLRGKLLVIWDGLPAHRSHLVKEYVRAQRGRITLEALPGYAPELNPGGVRLGLLEAPRTPEPVSEVVRRTQLPCPRSTPTHATTPDARRRLLATGGIVR